MTEPRVVLLAGGGTAGHVFPAVAVARSLAADGDLKPVFVGTRDRLEGRLVPEAGFELHHVAMIPFPRRPSPKLLRLPFALRRAVRQCAELAERTEAVAAVIFGGYVSFPLAWAASRLGMPLVVHEQNSVPGLANRVASRRADSIAVTFPGSADAFPHPERVVVTGNPVREEILDFDARRRRAEAIDRFGLTDERRTLRVFGGSQGSLRLNEAIVGSYELWRSGPDLQILHAAGRAHHGAAAAGWENARTRDGGPLVRCVDFIERMEDAYAVADVVVCRAGATTIAELSVLGKPAVLVPYPHATGDHQRYNAVALRKAGAAQMVLDAAVDPPTLVDAAEPLLEDEERREAMAAAARAFGRPDAAQNVARLVRRLVEERRTAR
jgi:UDP-N-acetylglucosamine--N-acetylmuramyl-(pentapeptide) pyrophosphoryl-undecaprenol N-acetylglucosamine transferase